MINMKVIYYLILLMPATLQDTPPTVKTKLGIITGTRRITENENSIYEFKGIPYAKPPTGKLRFNPPEAVDPWDGVLEATRDDIVCMQFRYTKSIVGVEDCLVLNIATPALPLEGGTLLPVMVYIHGGGFTAGSTTARFLGDGDYLTDKGVVVVTFNYRLGPLGFLSTEDRHAPGNYGLLDQIAALKWIQQNVASFGGNPDSVTIFGVSAGGASVHYLMLSPLAKGLFHRAISQSGSALNPWALTQTLKKNSHNLAEILGCPTDSSEELIDCLQNHNVERIVETGETQKTQTFSLLPTIWVPRVDSESDHPVLPRTPFDLMTSGDYNKVPWMAGHTREEGGLYVTEAIFQRLESELWLPLCKIFTNLEEFHLEEQKLEKICENIESVYFNNDSKSRKYRFIELIGDLWFVSGIQKSVEIMSNHHPVYSYSFAYESENTSLMTVMPPFQSKLKGLVVHADDLIYLFKFQHNTWTKASPEYKYVELMTSLWTSFAKTGTPSNSEPTVTWPASIPPQFQYLLLDKQVSIKESYRKEKMAFWDQVLQDTWYSAQTPRRDEL